LAASPEDAPLHLVRLANEPFKQDRRDVQQQQQVQRKKEEE
jgi:hypothetical protein